MNEYKILFLIIVLVISGITDILKGKIYNFVTFPGIVMGIAINWYYNSYSGLILSLSGLLISSVIFIILFMWGGFGAGDVKLMMAVGAIAGYKIIFDLILYSAVAGGIMANVVIIKNRCFLRTWTNVLRFFLFLIPGYKLKPEPLKKKNSIVLPYGYAISIGSLVYLYFNK